MERTIAHVLIAAGGTGGHIFPGLAVADYLQAKGVRISWLGGERGLEKKLVAEKYPLYTLPMTAFRGKGMWRKVLGLWQLLRAFLQAKRLLKQLRPDTVLVMGGYVSAPAGLAAKSLKIRLVVHEQNAVPGLANKWLAGQANAVLQAFPNTFPPKISAITVGNPLRMPFYQVPTPSERMDLSRPSCRVLVIGGSQGASAINQAVVNAARLCCDVNLEWWHQTGSADHQKIIADYQQLGVNARVEPFIDDMVAAMTWADVVIGRSGALSVSEIAAVGIASILIPYPHAVDDHQYKNASQLLQLGAAEVWRQSELTAGRLADKLRTWCNDKKTLLKMAGQAKQLLRVDSVMHVAAHCVVSSIIGEAGQQNQEL